jgi:hypothetical protein
MKNIHVLPTSQPSRLSILNSGKLNFGAEIMSSSNSKPQNIYITSDEQAKEGDWCYNSINNNVYKKEIDKLSFAYEYKIILTTDQDLIADGVQKINDEFLEWFVKNPSCEEVAVGTWSNFAKQGNLYHIIIPKEEQKQHLIDIMRGDEELGLYEEPKQEKPVQVKGGDNVIFPSSTTITFKPKQETLEEFIENGGYPTGSTQEIWEQGVREGAKWQQERMYSEEEVIAIVEKSRETGLTAEYLLLTEQFKKK